MVGPCGCADSYILKVIIFEFCWNFGFTHKYALARMCSSSTEYERHDYATLR